MRTKNVDLRTGRGTSLSPLQIKALYGLHVKSEQNRAKSSDRAGVKRRSFLEWCRALIAFGKNHIFIG